MPYGSPANKKILRMIKTLYFLVYCLSVKRHVNKNTKTLLAAVLPVAYLAALLKFFVFKGISLSIPFAHFRYRVSSGRVLRAVHNNYVPLRTIERYLHGHQSVIAASNLLGNIIPFMPLGFLLPLFYRTISWKGVLGIAIAFSLCIETLQLVLHTGTFDVDDILLNALGVMLGYGVFLLLAKRMR